MIEPKIILPLIFVVLALFVGIAIGVTYSNNQFNPFIPGNEGTACTQEAMMCPDGSYVGRTGPRCEFVCPGE